MFDLDLNLQTRLAQPVRLRRLTTADAVAFADHVARDEQRLQAHLPWPATTVTSEGAAEWLGPYERREDGRVIVAGAWSEDELVGGALLFHHDPGSGNIEIGCWVAAAAEGQGIASAACRALLAHAREELKVQRVEWHSTTVNERSRRLAERLGFRHEGTLRSSYVLNGVRFHTDVLSLVGDEIDRAAAG